MIWCCEIVHVFVLQNVIRISSAIKCTQIWTECHQNAPQSLAARRFLYAESLKKGTLNTPSVSEPSNHAHLNPHSTHPCSGLHQVLAHHTQWFLCLVSYQGNEPHIQVTCLWASCPLCIYICHWVTWLTALSGLKWWKRKCLGRGIWCMLNGVPWGFAGCLKTQGQLGG